jgi:probable rRNA maturation factor
MASINFFSEEINFKLKHPRKTSNWIKGSITKEKKSVESLNFIFCADSYLLEINTEYLNHKSLTDIITFNQSNNSKNGLEGDIYISIDRVIENSKKLKVLFDEELHRVIIHGVLHLIGYNDKDDNSKALMRKKEDAYLSLRK